MKRNLVCVAVALVAVGPGVAFAADYNVLPPAPAAAPEPAGWTITLGVEGRVLPTFEGSGRYELAPFPIINIRRTGTQDRFDAPRDGASLGLIDFGGFRAGVVGKLRQGRDQDDDADLIGLRDVDWAVEIGGFAEYWFSPLLRTRAEVRQGFGGHHGVVADFTGDVVYPIAPQWTLSGGPRLTLASAKANDPYFSVTPVESVLSGLPVYTARGGIYSYGAGAQLRYQWSPRWWARTFIEYERLAGSPADSPLVSLRGSRDQVTVGLGVAYSFDIGRFGIGDW